MIRAHMATYPKRRELLERAVRSVASQVDRVFLTLNDYAEVPPEIASIANVEPLLATEDFKDVGKFVTEPKSDDLVLFVDDDLIYPPDYVANLVASSEAIGLGEAVFGYHGSIYSDLDRKGANGRTVFAFARELAETICVDQLGTGGMLALGRNVAPLSVMNGSQKFVDVRYAKWLYQKGVDSWCLAHGKRFLKEMWLSEGEHETIYKDFTRKSPDYVIAEIRDFAGKGAKLGLKLGEAV